MSVEELHPEKNSIWNRWKATSVEWLAVIIACASLVICIVSMFVTSIAIAMVLSQSAHIEELSDKIGVMQVYITQHKGKHDE